MTMSCRTGSAGASSLILLLAAGCLAPPKIHSWQIPSDQSSILAEASRWAPLSTNLYVRVDEGKRSQAVALLQDQSFALVDREQAAAFARGFTPPPRNDLRPYLVRGVNYGGRPSYTLLRIDEPTNRLLVQQATYDGEMLWPTRWVMETECSHSVLGPPTERSLSGWDSGRRRDLPWEELEDFGSQMSHLTCQRPNDGLNTKAVRRLNKLKRSSQRRKENRSAYLRYKIFPSWLATQSARTR